MYKKVLKDQGFRPIHLIRKHVRPLALGALMTFALVTLMAPSHEGLWFATVKASNAVAGDLDPIFGTGGKVITDFQGIGRITAIAEQPDGKIVVAGQSGTIASQLLVARYNLDGTLDAGFGVGGMASTPLSLPPSTTFGAGFSSIAIQPDGKILATGHVEGPGGTDSAVFRLNANGTPDTTFGNAGAVSTDFGGEDLAYSVAVQADGKILVSGGNNQQFGGASDYTLARYNSNGSLDTSFDGDGKVTTDLGGSESATAVRVQTDGKIVAAGGIGMARYNSNGALDNSFDGDGKVTATGLSTFCLAIQPDGKIVVAGGSVARFNANGSADTTFDGDGVAASDYSVAGLALQLDGRIVTAGTPSSSTSAGLNLVASRYNANGSLDNTFDGDGKATFDLLGGSDHAFAVAIQTDGRILLGGDTNAPRVNPPSTSSGETSASNRFALLRVNIDGSLDQTFGSAGKVITPALFGTDSATAMALQSDGKIVVVGENYAGLKTGADAGAVVSSDDFRIARYNADGSLDATFGTGGRVKTDLGCGDAALSVAIQPDGKIIAAGVTWTGCAQVLGEFGDFALVRYNSDGSLDNTFGTAGKVITNVAGWDMAMAIALQPDGKIVIAGSRFGMAVVRYLASGSLDASFGTNGKAVVATSASGTDMTLQPDGKIIAIGQTTVSGDNRSLIARLTANGALDPTFGTGGINTDQPGIPRAVRLQSDGRIVTAGESATVLDFVLRRYNTNGSVDSSFGTNGTTFTDFTGGADAAFALAIQSDDKIIAAGAKNLIRNPGGDFALARYAANGVLDTSFGTGGRITTDFGNDGDVAQAVLIQPDKKIVAAGFTWAPSIDFAIARYVADPPATPTPTPTPAAGFEGDINIPVAGGLLGTGDNDVTIADVIIYNRVVIGEICPGASNPNFQQKLDAGPRTSRGDGLLGSADGSAIDAYSRHDASTDADPATPGWQATPAGGPMTISNLGCTPAAMADPFATFSRRAPDPGAGPRTFELVPVSIGNARERVVVMDVVMTADGTEGGTQFSLHWDPSLARLSQISGVDVNPDVGAAEDAPRGTSLNVNAEHVLDGDVGLAANFVAGGDVLDSGRRRIVRLRFHLAEGAELKSSDISFTDNVLRQQTVDTFGSDLDVPGDLQTIGSDKPTALEVFTSALRVNLEAYQLGGILGHEFVEVSYWRRARRRPSEAQG